MPIHDGSPFMASLTRLPGDTVGVLSVVHTGSAPAADLATKTQRKHIFNVIFDNSGSMGDSTRLGLDTIVRRLHEQDWFDLTLVTLFDDATRTYEITSKSAFDSMMAALPRQGSTNIRRGVEDSMALLSQVLTRPTMRSATDCDEVHVLTMLLTDGGHNAGDPITTASALDVAGKIAALPQNLMHTVLIFCLTNSSDAQASMIVKESLENAKIPALPNVFFAPSHSEMVAALQEVEIACGELFDSRNRGGLFGDLQLAQGTEFIANGQPRLTHRFPPKHTQNFIVTLSPGNGSSNWLVVNKDKIPVLELPAGPQAVSLALAAVKDALQPLSRQAVAFSVAAIEKRIQSLEVLIGAVDKVVEEQKRKAAQQQDGSAGFARTPAERRAMLKRFVTAQHGVHEIRNALSALRVKGRSNSDAIALLTGNQRKFAHVASKRSGTEGRTAAEVAADTRTVGAALQALLAEDCSAPLSDLSNGAAPYEAPTTAITLQTPAELLEQWSEPAETDDAFSDVYPVQSNDEAITDVLSSFGVAAYPVKLFTNDATQVDVMQMRVDDICCQLADSASMMLSWRLNMPIKFADGNTYSELLLLVDPAMPRASMHVLSKSMLVQHLLSAMISKDLFMYLPGMHSAMHTHAFVTTVRKAITDAPAGSPPLGSFIRLALHVVYSARRLFDAKVVFESSVNFPHWLYDLQSLTRSQTDQVFHVAALSLKLAMNAVDITEVDDRAAVLNQLNEHIARRLAPLTQSAAFASPATFAHRLFGIHAEDAPQPSGNDLEPEPAESAVWDSCRRHLDQGSAAGVDAELLAKLGGAPNVRAWIEQECLPLFNLHQLSLSLHRALRTLYGRHATMDDFTAIVEKEREIPGALVAEVQRLLDEWGTGADALWHFLLGDEAGSAKVVDAVCAAMVMQACLYPGTQERSGFINTIDVTDPEEQRTMIGRLYMLHYHVLSGLKRGRRTAIIGEVTALQAASMDVQSFADLVGQHTHGHSKRVFWGMLRGVLADASAARRQQKIDLFLGKSNASVATVVVRRSR
jgi:hypothetical protein